MDSAWSCPERSLRAIGARDPARQERDPSATEAAGGGGGLVRPVRDAAPPGHRIHARQQVPGPHHQRQPQPTATPRGFPRSLPRKDKAPASAADYDGENYPDLSSSRGIAAHASTSRQVPMSREEDGIPPPPLLKDVVARGCQTRDPSQVYKEWFSHLLNNFGKKEGRMSRYQVIAEINARSGSKCYVLEVDFNHLLEDQQYMALAIEVTRTATNNPEHLWLQSTAQDFLNVVFKLKGNEKQRLSFRFVNEAKSVKPLCEYKQTDLVKRQPVFGGVHHLLKTSHKGRHVYLSVLNKTLAVHSSRKAWNGKFNMNDIYIVEYKDVSKMECVIHASTTDLNGDGYNEKVRDLQMVNTLVTPKYQVGDEYPAYFVNLKADLEQLTVSKLRDTGFLVSLPFHLALMSPAARCFLLTRLHYVTQMLSRGSDFSIMFNKMVRQDKKDWTPDYKNSKDVVLSGVYHHKNRGNDKFKNNVNGMVKYKRHLVQHAHNHLGKNRVCNADEPELFAAWKVPLVLPIIVDVLFSGKSMKYKKELGSTWSDYCSMCYNKDEDNPLQ